MELRLCQASTNANTKAVAGGNSIPVTHYKTIPTPSAAAHSQTQSNTQPYSSLAQVDDHNLSPRRLHAGGILRRHS